MRLLFSSHETISKIGAVVMKLPAGVATNSGVSSLTMLDGKVDGRRKRRHSQLKARRDWYAKHRAERFARHLWYN